MKIKKTNLLVLLVPLLMLFFFVRNVVYEKHYQMDSWMGGGMRMFGEIDCFEFRIAGFNIQHNDKTYFMNFSTIPEFKDDAINLKILPKNDRLEKVLHKVKHQTWYYDETAGAFYLNTKNKTTDFAIPSSAITGIMVYRVDFENETNKVQLKLLNEITANGH